MPLDPSAPEDFVAFDLRRNIINILGEDHYPFAEYLYHELCANAYDADATEVHITERVLEPAARGRLALLNVEIFDNGNGMDYQHLVEYFAVGESSKPSQKISERLKRLLIGQIGVGKVAILKVADRWTITTERTLGLRRPVRLQVHVDVGKWVAGDVKEFRVERLKPTGKSGTTLELRGVEAKLREDRILRHIQRLPLDDDFRVFRNGELIPPRRWFGIQRHPLDVDVDVRTNHATRTEHIHGEIWIRSEGKTKLEQAYVNEPKSVKEGLRREAAGIEVRVNRDVITREFFGHETGGHRVNRIWGWVDAPWLEILGNRTDYQRDSPTGRAFYDAMKPIYDDIYDSIRYLGEVRGRRDGEARGSARQTHAASGGGGTDQESGLGRNESVASADRVGDRYGEVLGAILQDNPSFAPYLPGEAAVSRGQPRKDRVYPLRPSSDGKQPFEANPKGERVAIRRETLEEVHEQPVTGDLRKLARRAARKDGVNSEAQELPLARLMRNPAAGIAIRFESLPWTEGLYRWELDDPAALALKINTSHRLYLGVGNPGSHLHRLYSGYVIGLALAERLLPVSGHLVADYVETITSEFLIKSE